MVPTVSALTTEAGPLLVSFAWYLFLLRHKTVSGFSVISLM